MSEKDMISRRMKTLKRGEILRVETIQQRNAAYQWAWRNKVKIKTRPVLGAKGFDILKVGKKKA